MVPSHRVDPRIIPRPYKLYRDLPVVALPPPSEPEVHRSLVWGRPLGLEALSAILHFSAGILRKRVLDGREIEFRAAACTGALYHVEPYVVAGEIEGLAPGVYHYSVHEESLRRIRAGDFREALASASADPRANSVKATILFTSAIWRNAWRYEDRAYRHVFWDSGTILANLQALARAHHQAAELDLAF